jgi:NAD(P)-dependent dehydrogenase (short-subunit alcohol dehydrogenase family)
MSDLIIITGASSGIGRHLAEVAAADGAQVATMSRRPGPGNHLTVDLSQPDGWPTVVGWITELVSERDHPHISFVHNAGTLEPIGFAGEVDLERYRNNVLVNSAAGQVLGAGFLAAMAARRAPANGLLIMMSSGAGKHPYPGWSSYCAAKAALDMWVRTVGLEQRERIGDPSADSRSPVTVAAIAPGVVATAMQDMIRDQDEGRFPNVERFRDLHRDGDLADPASVGAKFWRLCRRHAIDPGVIDQGTVCSITDFD